MPAPPVVREIPAFFKMTSGQALPEMKSKVDRFPPELRGGVRKQSGRSGLRLSLQTAFKQFAKISKLEVTQNVGKTIFSRFFSANCPMLLPEHRPC